MYIGMLLDDGVVKNLFTWTVKRDEDCLTSNMWFMRVRET